MGMKMAVAFANIFMAKIEIEIEILRQSNTKPIFWKRFIDDIISMWNTSRDKIEDVLLKANSFHPTIKFTAEISETETAFLETKVYKGTDSVTQYHLALPNLKDTLMGKWHLIDNQPQLREIFKESPIISYRKGKSLKDILVKAKL